MMNKARLPDDLKERIGELRRDSTDAENLLWQILRNRGLLNAKFRRQHPLGGFILDFYCADAKLDIELDGGQHAERNHAQYDQERSQILGEQYGVGVVRFSNSEVLEHPEDVLKVLTKALTSRLSIDATEPIAEGIRLPSPPVKGTRDEGQKEIEWK